MSCHSERSEESNPSDIVLMVATRWMLRCAQHDMTGMLAN
jgi:hypothetical protein